MFLATTQWHYKVVCVFLYRDLEASSTAKESTQALQGDDVGVFCVDTAKGEKIPGTIEYHHSPVRRPISEAVCQAYSDQCKLRHNRHDASQWACCWMVLIDVCVIAGQAYMDYIRSTLKVEEDHHDDEEVTAESCL